MKIKKIKDGMYGQEIYFVYNCPQDKIINKLNKQYGLKLEKSLNAVGSTYEFANEAEDHHLFYVWVERFKRTNHDISVLAHEVLHLAFSGLEFVGIKYDSQLSEEAFTYYFDHLLEGFLNAAK